MQIGIISYLPDNLEMRERRLYVHNKQIEWIKNYFNNIELTVVAQNYQNSDKNSLVDNYIMVDKCGPSNARNYLLERLYKSDNNFTCILDNDAILYEYYNVNELLTQMDEHPNQFENLDLIESLSPVRCGFKEVNTTLDRVLRYWVFERQYKGTTQHFAIFKNLKKYYNEEIYYSAKTFEEFGGGEDTEIGCHFTAKGYNVVRCNQMIENHMEYDKSTIFFDESGNHMKQEDRGRLDRSILVSVASKYDYLSITPSGGLKIEYKPSIKHSKNVYGAMRGGKVTTWSIPRTNPYNIPDNLVWKPRDKQTGKKKLI